MDWDVFAKNFTSWLTHLFPLLIASGLFMFVYLFMEKIYMFFFLVLVTFIVSVVLDRQFKKGFVVGIIAAAVLFILNFMFWINYVRMKAVANSLSEDSMIISSMVGMFGEPLHPLIFLPLIIVSVFGPLVVVWFLRKSKAETNQVSKL